MKILVTGGAGFIGSHLVERLIKQNHQPVVLDNLSTGNKKNLPSGIRFYQMELADKRIEKLLKKEEIQAVCHLAASTNVLKSIEEPLNDIENNIFGMVNLLEACQKNGGIKRFVFSSTGGALYGDTKHLPTPENHSTYPISPYGIDKLTGENYLYFYHKVYNLPVTILRYSNVYGPRQDRKGEGGVVAIFIQKIINNEKSTINGDGEQTRDFIFVEDIAKANSAALNQKAKNFSIYNISTGKETSINCLFKTLARNLNYSLRPKYGSANKGEINRSCLDPSLAKKELKWNSEHSIEEGIKKTINYFRNNY